MVHDLARAGLGRADDPLEESTGRPQIAPGRDEHFDGLPKLIDRTVSSACQRSPTECRQGLAGSASNGVNRTTSGRR